MGYRAVHLTAEAAKSVINHYYDEIPRYSYFVGCSWGGGQGMMESQRYPNDFDGIVAGAPAYEWTAFTAGMVQTYNAIYPEGDLLPPLLSPATLETLAASIDAACDLDDGIDDDILGDPRSCDFTPEELPQCAGNASGPDCLTVAELRALNVIYGGPTSDGEAQFPGFPLGGENDLSRRLAFGAEFFKYFVFDDPQWDYTTYDFSRWAEDTAAIMPLVDATDPDLSAFDAAGGKMIFWAGWSDPMITALGTVQCYDAIVSAGSDVRSFARLFLLPGVQHCGGGPGPDAVGWLDAIQAWVERGDAPERLVARRFGVDDEIEVARPICAYPQVAIYDGQGDVTVEDSFACWDP